MFYLEKINYIILYFFHSISNNSPNNIKFGLVTLIWENFLKVSLFRASISSLPIYPPIFEWLYIKHFIGHSRLNRTRQIVTDLDRWQTFMTLKISGIFDVFLMVSNSMRSFPPHKDSRRGANSFNFYRQHNHIIWISQFCPHILLWIIFQEFRKTEMKNI